MDAQQLNDETILEAGHAALTEALGAAGAMRFLQLQQNAPERLSQADGRKRLGVRVGLQGGDAVVLNFSRPISWLRLEGGEAMQLASKIEQGAQTLIGKPNTGEN